MAGYGRNAEILKKYYHKIDMLDSSKEWLDKCPDYVTKIHKKVQEFNWPLKEYSSVFGCWFLCYLETIEAK